MLVSKTNQLIEEVNEVKDLCLKQIGPEIEHMDGDVFALCQKALKLLNTSTEVIKEQAEVIESIDKKLDRLLQRKES